ncbi:MAG: hypothetical protein K1W26_18650, partial [Acetatifactor sp.]
DVEPLKETVQTAVLRLLYFTGQLCIIEKDMRAKGDFPENRVEKQFRPWIYGESGLQVSA